MTGLIDTAAWIGVPAIVIGELLAGYLAGARAERNETDLADFLADPYVETLHVDPDVAQIYAEILTTLRQTGTPLPSNDVWIAATSIRAGAPLLTFDRHFQQIARLGTVLLEPEH